MDKTDSDEDFTFSDDGVHTSVCCQCWQCRSERYRVAIREFILCSGLAFKGVDDSPVEDVDSGFEENTRREIPVSQRSVGS